MNEENTDLELENAWGDEGGEGAAEESAADPAAPAREEAGSEHPAQEAAPPKPEPPAAAPPKAPGQEHPLLERARQNARRQDMERFLQTYPDVKAEAVPKEVWARVARGDSLVNAYTMHENKRLAAELAAERQNRENRRKTPGPLGANAGREMDEIDRMWAEDD